MKLAFYKASSGNWLDKAINLFTGLYGYSHVELVFSDGMCFSCSPRENETRFKKIDLDDDKWVVVDVECSDTKEELIREQAEKLVGKKYDWWGIFFYFVIPLKKQSDGKWWCSEICAYLLKWIIFRVHPNRMAKGYELPKQPYSFSISFSKKI